MENRGVEEPGIRAMPLVVIALLLIVPFLNLSFTYYRMTLKLFAFQTAVTVLWGALAVEWARGKLADAAWPAWWLMAPLGAWVAWGAVTMLWSPQPGLAGNWLVQGLYGWLGALGLSLLLREQEVRDMFVTAASAVAVVLALWMIAVYNAPTATFFGDRDLLGPQVGAAFLLVPTLVAAAALYGVRRAADGEPDYRGVLWLVLALVVFLAAGVRSGVTAWAYGLALGAAVVVWLLIPRWRMLAPLVAAVAIVGAAQREVQRSELGRGPIEDERAVQQARLDRADWGLWANRPVLEKLAGHGVGTFFVAYDLERPVETYATSGGGGLVYHARRHVTEALFERGIVGIGLALLAGAACVLAGATCARNARDRQDRALAVGAAAGAVGMGAFACLGNGSIGFGGGLMFWLSMGLLGALTALYRRGAGTARSSEEAQWRAERLAMRRRGGVLAAAGVVVAGAVLWFMLGARPFWAELALRDGAEEHAALEALIVQFKRLIAKRDTFSPNGLRYLEARRQGEEAAITELKKDLPPEAIERLERFRESVESGRVGLLESARRTRRRLSTASALSLGDRVRFMAQFRRLRYAIDRFALDGSNREEVETVGQGMLDCYGPVVMLDLHLARFALAVGELERAHGLFLRYALKNPFAAQGALGRARTDVYRYWHMMIVNRHAAADPRARGWARDFVTALRSGLAVDPDRYTLQERWGRLLYELGRVEEAYFYSLRALDRIEEVLAQRRDPLVQARLLLEGARVAMPWDPELAAGLTAKVFALSIDFNRSEYQGLLLRAVAIMRELGFAPPTQPGEEAGAGADRELAPEKEDILPEKAGEAGAGAPPAKDAGEPDVEETQ